MWCLSLSTIDMFQKQTIITTEKTLRDMYDYDGAVLGEYLKW